MYTSATVGASKLVRDLENDFQNVDIVQSFKLFPFSF